MPVTCSRRHSAKESCDAASSAVNLARVAEDRSGALGAAKDSQKEPGMLLSSLALALAARATVKAAWMPSALSATFALPSETTFGEPAQERAG